MHYLSLVLLLASSLAGCGATYTKFDSPAPSKNTLADNECPNGINYKTGRCR